jgi:hypothetical protein
MSIKDIINKLLSGIDQYGAPFKRGKLMKIYLVSYYDNWADERDIEGSFFLESEDIDADLKAAAEAWGKDNAPRYQHYVGPQDDFIEYAIRKNNYDRSGGYRSYSLTFNLKDLLSTYSYQEVTNTERSTIIKFFGKLMGENQGPLADILLGWVDE